MMVRAFALFLHNFTREPGGFLSRLSLTLCKPGQGFFSSAINWNTYSYWLLQSSAMLLFHLHIHILCIAVALWFLFLSQYYPLGPFGAPFMRISSVTLREAELHTDYLFCSANCPYFLYFSSLLSRDRWSLFVQAHFGFSAPSCHRSAHRPASYFVTTCSLGKKNTRLPVGSRVKEPLTEAAAEWGQNEVLYLFYLIPIHLIRL